MLTRMSEEEVFIAGGINVHSFEKKYSEFTQTDWEEELINYQMKDLGETGKYNEIQYWDWEQYRDWKLSQNIEEQEKKEKEILTAA